MRKALWLLAFSLIGCGTLCAQVANPDWCKALPRPEYKTLGTRGLRFVVGGVQRSRLACSRSTNRIRPKKQLDI